MNTPYVYDTSVQWIEGRRGALDADGLPSVTVDAPAEFKGRGGAWTPEHLFVGAVASCFMTTFVAIAELSKLEFVALAANATGRLEKVEGRGYLMTEVVLRARLSVARDEDVERASRLLDKAERNCLISNSITSTVRLEKEIVVVPTLAPTLA